MESTKLNWKSRSHFLVLGSQFVFIFGSGFEVRRSGFDR